MGVESPQGVALGFNNSNPSGWGLAQICRYLGQFSTVKTLYPYTEINIQTA